MRRRRVFPRPTPNESFGEFLIRTGTTLDQVAAASDISAATASRVARGIVDPSPETVLLLASGMRIQARTVAAMLRRDRLAELQRQVHEAIGGDREEDRQPGGDTA